MASREITVNYMTPLGLHHIMGWDHHYGPAPWIKDKPRADWTSVYYHQADAQESVLIAQKVEVTRWANTLPRCNENMEPLRIVRRNTCFGFTMCHGIIK